MSKKPKIQTRKPPSISPAALEDFVSGGSGGASEKKAAEELAPRPRRSIAPAAKTTIYTRKAGESAGEELRRVTLYFPTDLHQRARIAAVQANRPLSDMVVEMVERALSSKR
ncbi:MAG: hypothetical protein Q8L14_21795 [Myxococcales bacterium]|nr:hypothetical protein [Myxococcales bacterium]